MQKLLLGHLAQFATFSRQGELLCTQSLGYLLGNQEANRIFAKLLGAVAECEVDCELSWHAESRQLDGRRPDLEGRNNVGATTVKIEGKLGASVGQEQVGSYYAAFPDDSTIAVLAILVPQRRYEEICSLPMQGHAPLGRGRWYKQGSREVRTVVLTWEQTLDALEGVVSEAFQADLQQLRAMYRVLNGDVMEPLTTEAEVLAWREKELWWNTLVDLTTRELTPDGLRVNPLGMAEGSTPYYCRAIREVIGGKDSFFRVGTRDPFAGHRTPIWIRFHRDTAFFSQIKDSLEKAALLHEAVQSEGHLWFPLHVPMGKDRREMVDDLVRQSLRYQKAAYSFVKAPKEHP